MTSADGNAMLVEVLDSTGKVLGTLKRKARNHSWRLLGLTPMVTLFRGRVAEVIIRVDGTRRVTLLPGETPPKDLSPLLTTEAQPHG